MAASSSTNKGNSPHSSGKFGLSDKAEMALVASPCNKVAIRVYKAETGDETVVFVMPTYCAVVSEDIKHALLSIASLGSKYGMRTSTPVKAGANGKVRAYQNTLDGSTVDLELHLRWEDQLDDMGDFDVNQTIHTDAGDVLEYKFDEQKKGKFLVKMYVHDITGMSVTPTIFTDTLKAAAVDEDGKLIMKRATELEFLVFHDYAYYRRLYEQKVHKDKVIAEGFDDDVPFEVMNFYRDHFGSDSREAGVPEFNVPPEISVNMFFMSTFLSA